MGVKASQITSISIVLSRLFRQKSKKTTKLCHWPLWGESTGDWWIPLIKAQWRGIFFPFDDVIMEDKDPSILYIQ